MPAAGGIVVAVVTLLAVAGIASRRARPRQGAALRYAPWRAGPRAGPLRAGAQLAKLYAAATTAFATFATARWTADGAERRREGTAPMVSQAIDLHDPASRYE